MGERSDDMKRIREEEVLGTTYPPESATHVEHVETEHISPARSGDEDLEAIRAEIEQTRAEMSETLNAIQTKLSPDNIREQARDRVREATVGRAKHMAGEAGRKAKGLPSAIMETIKDNPLPAALIGLGVGWLMMESKKGSSYEYEEDYIPEGRYVMDEGDYLHEDMYQAGLEEPGTREYGYGGSYRTQGHYGSERGRMRGGYDAMKGSAESAKERTGYMAGQAREKASHLAGQTKEKASHFTEQVREKTGSVVGQVREKTGHLTEQVREKAAHVTGQAWETAGHLGSETRHKAEQLSGQVQYQARRAKTGFWHTMEESPLMIAAAAFLAGATVGFTVPETRREHELMGEARESLKLKAQEVGHEAMEKVQRVAEEAQRAAMEEAEKQHITPQETMDKVESVVTEAKDAAKHEAKKEGFGAT